jgi:hypothetical protein
MAYIRALVLVVSLLWQQVAAQDGENNFVIPAGRTTYEVTAGQPLTVEWTNPSSSTVTIKLQVRGGSIHATCLTADDT